MKNLKIKIVVLAFLLIGAGVFSSESSAAVKVNQKPVKEVSAPAACDVSISEIQVGGGADAGGAFVTFTGTITVNCWGISGSFTGIVKIYFVKSSSKDLSDDYVVVSTQSGDFTPEMLNALKGYLRNRI